MEQEINISGRILKNAKAIASNNTIEYSFKEFAFSIHSDENGKTSIATKGNVPEVILADFCKTISREFEATVYLWKDIEDYGNANVFNGGSDYEVINEICFLSICKNGEVLCEERSNHWNEKIDEVL